MNLKHRKSTSFPDISENVQSSTAEVLKDLFRSFSTTFRNIYDDLSNISVNRVDALPTASRDYLGRYFLLTHASADDTLHICIYEGATSTYDWRAVTLT